MAKCKRGGNTYKRHQWAPKTTTIPVTSVVIELGENVGFPTGGQVRFVEKCKACGVERGVTR